MGRQLAPGYICAPTWVRLEGDDGEERLRWGFDFAKEEEPYDPTKDQWKRVRPSRDLLQRFLKLAEAPPEQIEKFAKRWGVLGICEDHGLPYSHQPACLPMGFPRNCHEPISAWREISRRLGAVSRIASELSADERGADSDWWTLKPQFKNNRPFDSIWVDESRRNWRALKRKEALTLARSFLRNEVDELLNLGDVGLQLEWQPAGRSKGVQEPARWALRVRYGHWLNLFGALVLQLLLELCESDGLYSCDGCGIRYARDGKRPNEGEKNWCPECRKDGAPEREADKRRRAKVKEARKLAGRGIPPELIAERLQTTPESVSRWLKPRKRRRKS